MTTTPSNGSGSHRMRRAPLSAWLLFAGLALVFCACLLASPAAAHASDYSMGPVNIDATVAADGSMTVTEDRTFSFSGDYHGVYWDIPIGTYNERELKASVLAAGLVSDASFTPFKTVGGFNGTDDTKSGTYEAFTTTNDSGTSVLRIKLYSDQSNTDATFRVSYTMTGGTSAWTDTGEVYWKFVSDGWGKQSDDITCTLHLPVPATASNAAESIHAWAHGPLNGTIDITSDGATFAVPEVGANEYAEMRVVFPVSWLSGMTPSSTAKLDTIQNEEATWAQQANDERNTARMQTTGFGLGAIAVAIVAFIYSLVNFLKFRRAHTLMFHDEYFRDVPTDDHPAVLGCLWNEGGITTAEVKATLMRLTDLKAIALERLDENGNVVHSVGTGKDAAVDYRITRITEGKKVALDTLDSSAMTMLFDDLAPFLGSANDGIHLPLSSLASIAASNPDQYSAAIAKWGDEVQTAAAQRGFFDYTNTYHRETISGLGILTIAVGATVAAYVASGENPLWVVVLVGAIISAICCFLMCAKMKPFPAEAMEIRAKLKALRKWLLEFTNLKEDPPESVVVWNRLLVMAVILGVSGEVIDQLKVAAPQVLSDAAIAPTYAWLATEGGLASAGSMVDQPFVDKATLSDSQVAGSEDSSESGDDDGFSGSDSGGGGFGGGGGGGAF